MRDSTSSTSSSLQSDAPSQKLTAADIQLQIDRLGDKNVYDAMQLAEERSSYPKDLPQTHTELNTLMLQNKRKIFNTLMLAKGNFSFDPTVYIDQYIRYRENPPYGVSQDDLQAVFLEATSLLSAPILSYIDNVDEIEKRMAQRSKEIETLQKQLLESETQSARHGTSPGRLQALITGTVGLAAGFVKLLMALSPHRLLHRLKNNSFIRRGRSRRLSSPMRTAKYREPDPERIPTANHPVAASSLTNRNCPVAATDGGTPQQQTSAVSGATARTSTDTEASQGSTYTRRPGELTQDPVTSPPNGPKGPQNG